jgi:phosphoribosylanthranilate isomerase
MSTGMLVKICGVSDVDSARVACEAGANFIGLVFYPGSHRFVTREQALEVSTAVHAFDRGEGQYDGIGVELVSTLNRLRPRSRVETSSTPTGVRSHPRVVGLFVNEPVEVVVETRERVGLDIVQLSGSEPIEDMRRLRRLGIPYIATVRGGAGDDEGARRRFNEIVEQAPFAVILDTHVPGMWGGSGVVGDWDLAREFAAAFPLFLAGGLEPGNVGAAIEVVEPFAVDVSTGVETDEIKDHQKIRAFIHESRNGRQARR